MLTATTLHPNHTVTPIAPSAATRVLAPVRELEPESGSPEPGSPEPGAAEPGAAEQAPSEPGAAECALSQHAPSAVRRGWWARSRQLGNDAGLATAEYAVVLIAAVGFAGLLVTILTSDEIRATLLGLVRTALSVG